MGKPKISSDTYIKSIPEGTEFVVIDGPICSDNYLFWRIKLEDNTTAWAAEGDNNLGYFIEPVP